MIWIEPMRVVTKLRLLFALMLVLCLSGAGLSVWSARQAEFYVHRMDLAHRVYEAHLSLTSHTYQLFKQYGDSLIVGELDIGVGKEELIEAIRADIFSIRSLIGAEIDLVGGEEIEELDDLSEIELKIEELITTLERVSDGSSEEPLSSNWWEISRILDADIDRDFRGVIGAALEEELEEVEETRQSVSEDLLVYQLLAALFALVAIAATMTRRAHSNASSAARMPPSATARGLVSAFRSPAPSPRPMAAASPSTTGRAAD